MAKKKKRKVATPSKGKKKKDNPVAELMREYPDLTRELAQEIADTGLSYEEWQEEQERKREERRKANQERIISMICSQHPSLSREQALDIVTRGITPEEYLEELKQQQIRERRQSRGRGGGGPRGFRRGGAPGAGGRPPQKKKKKWDKTRVSKKKQLRKQAVDSVLEKHPDLDDRAVAGQIASGRLTYEQWLENKNKPKIRKRRPSHRSEDEHAHAQQLREERQQALQERVERESHLGNRGDEYFQEHIDKETVLQVLRFHKKSFSGVLTKYEPFRLFMRTETNPNMALTKRFCSAIVEQDESNKVLSQCQISLYQRAMRQVPHHEPKMRYQIPEDVLQEGQQVWVMLHEGVQVIGKLAWSDRFQFLVEMPEGGEVFIFRHAVHRASQEIPELEGEVMSYTDFMENPPELPDVHPKELPLSELFIPVQFNDYSVKDVIFEKYMDAYDKGEFTFDPLYVRREGDHYVLVDGYRRWILAKEKNVETIPIIVM